MKTLLQFNTYPKLLEAIDSLLLNQSPLNLAIDGNSGSGKSTLASFLESLYDCNVFHMDDFFLRPFQRTPERLQEVGGNVDYERFKEEIADKMGQDEPFTYQVYDCSVCKLTKSISVLPKKINIVEGVYSLHPSFRDKYHLKVFLTLDEKVQSERILERSGPSLHQRFINEWIPKENKYFTGMGVKETADFVFITDDFITCHND